MESPYIPVAGNSPWEAWPQPNRKDGFQSTAQGA